MVIKPYGLETRRISDRKNQNQRLKNAYCLAVVGLGSDWAGLATPSPAPTNTKYSGNLRIVMIEASKESKRR